MALQVIITAGGPLPRDMRHGGHSPNKALLEVGGGTLLSRALAAAGALAQCGAIIVVGDEHVQAALPPGIGFVPSGGSVVDNMVRGFEHHGGRGHDYLVVSSDLPFLTATALAQFLEAAQAQAELGVPLITRECFLARFPGAPNFFEHIGGRQVTMGSAFYFSGPLLQANIPLMRDFAKYRKYPHKLAMLLGWEVLWGFILRRVTIPLLEARASAITGGVVKAVEVGAAELAFDIDSRREYEYAVGLARTANEPA
jgi:hypothetical protein